MAAEEEKSNDFYTVLGLKKECTAAELRIAYKKLAMRSLKGRLRSRGILWDFVKVKWHPDRCSASGNLRRVEEAKKKFQSIQQAYSVLSDANKRFLYDVGVYDSDDDNDENGMGDFLNEMASMMSQSKPNENKYASFEELQLLFEEIFHGDSEVSGSSSGFTSTPPTYMSSEDSCSETCSTSNKRSSCDMSSSNFSIEATQFKGFCIGENITLGRAAEERIQGRAMSSRRDGRKQKVSSGHDVSSGKYSGIST